MSAWRVVGVSGATCGGKTTLVNFLRKNFEGSALLFQDDFFLDKESDRHVIIPELNHANWECLESIDWDAMMKKVQETLNSNPRHEDALLLIEGHIIYNYPPLEKLIGTKYFLTITKEECRRRRSCRVYDPPDPHGYFDICVWPMYLSNKEYVERKCTNVRYIDGTLSADVICQQVLTEIRNK